MSAFILKARYAHPGSSSPILRCQRGTRHRMVSTPQCAGVAINDMLGFCGVLTFSSYFFMCKIKTQMFFTDLKGQFVSGVLPGHDLAHLLRDVFLCGSLHIDVITVRAGVVAGDGLDVEKHSIFSGATAEPVWLCGDQRWTVDAGPCGSPASGSCLNRGSAADGRRLCRPSPSPGEPGGAAGRSHALRDTFCSRPPGDG